MSTVAPAPRPIVVLKVGTSSLVDTSTGRVQVSAIARIVEVSSALTARGYSVILVSSGAVGLGCVRLGLKERPTSIAGKQAAAAVGQLKLMSLYDDFFGVLGHGVAQILLTYDNFGAREQYLNARNALLELPESLGALQRLYQGPAHCTLALSALGPLVALIGALSQEEDSYDAGPAARAAAGALAGLLEAERSGGAGAAAEAPPTARAELLARRQAIATASARAARQAAGTPAAGAAAAPVRVEHAPHLESVDDERQEVGH